MTILEIVWENKAKIVELKNKLAKTDYQAIKYAEGELTLAEYSATKEQRKQWRAEINALETQNKTLQGAK